MMYNEVRSGEISCLSFLKGTPYVMYIGPELSPAQRAKLRCDSIHVPVIYLPEILEAVYNDSFYIHKGLLTYVNDEAAVFDCISRTYFFASHGTYLSVIEDFATLNCLLCSAACFCST